MRFPYIAGMLAIAALHLPVPATAQSEPIEAPAGGAWTHAKTGTVMPHAIGAFERGEMTSKIPGELDVIAQYEAKGLGAFATVFVFRPPAPNVPMWFDRAKTALEADTRWNTGKPDYQASFALPGSANDSGLRAVYATSGDYSATGVALVPLGAWIGKVRMTSARGTPEQLDAMLRDFVSAIGWPQAARDAPPAKPVQACASPLKFDKEAKVYAPSGTQAIFGAMSGLTAQQERSAGKADEPAYYCLDSRGSNYGVYRPEASRKSYVIALDDAGRDIFVQPTLDLSGRGNRRYAITVRLLDRQSVYPETDRLPSPSAVGQIVSSYDPVSTVSTGEGKPEMILDAPAE